MRNPSGITPSHPAGVSNDQQLSKHGVPDHGNASTLSTPKRGPAEQPTVRDTTHRSALPSWVQGRAVDGRLKPLKSESEQLTTSEDYLTCTEVAAVLRVSLRTVRRLIAQGRIPHIRVDVGVANRRAALDAEIRDTGDKLARLYRAIEEGVVELDAQLKERIAALKSTRDLAQASLERIATQAATSRALTSDRIAAFVDLVRQKIETADIQARKAYLATVVSEIRVDDHKVQIIGDKASLAAVIAGQQTAGGKVSGFVRKWRTMQDSNPGANLKRSTD